MAPKLIAFDCEAPAHRPDLSHPDKLTIHEGHWAFCRFSARADGHVWRATGGEDVVSLMRKAGLAVGATGDQMGAAKRATSLKSA
jgi:hypothetical protein